MRRINRPVTRAPRGVATAAPERPSPRRILGRLAVLLAALALTALGFQQLWHSWRHLPALQVQRLDWKAVNRARGELAGVAREGLVLLINSRRYTAVWQSRLSVADGLAEIRERLGERRHTQLGRLQLVGLTLLRLDRDHVPPETWWSLVGPQVEELERANLPHFMDELADAEAGIFRGHNLSPGVATQLARSTLGGAHGVFLEDTVVRLSALGQQQGAAGDTHAAEACSRLLLRLLREWVLTPAPLDLRLLAADLLARRMERSDSAANFAEPVVKAIRAWRTRQRDALASQLPEFPLLSVGAATPGAAGRGAAQALFVSVWLLAATLATAIVAVGMYTFSRSRGTGDGTWPEFCVAIGLALAIAGSGWLVLAVGGDDLIIEELRRLDTPSAGWPRLLPLAAVAAMLLPLLASGLLHWLGRRTAFSRRLARICALVWLTLAVALPCAAFWTTYQLRRHDIAVAASPSAGDERLADVRAWNP